MRYYRCVVALGHQGTISTSYETWHLATELTPADLIGNTGHALAGIKRVVEVHEETAADYSRAECEGQECKVINTSEGRVKGEGAKDNQVRRQ